MSSKLVVALFVCFCVVFVASAQDLALDSKTTTKDLVGEISRHELVSHPVFNEWFSNNFENYQLDSKTIDRLKAIPTKDLSFKIIMGTWCSDSQRDVPRFARILEELNIAESAINYYALDADKLSPEKIEETYHVSHVPTFIIYKNGKELNRIVEMSIRTLEEDLLLILTTNDYQHIYAD
ncbi:Thioredoxin [Bizionia echini]|uniref:Thioredoxin n=1 Tax=Bizionia echini TaxID=649333 RepID=A0A1I5ARH7_9FLAO|nr:thioredoxin family protein [Bizionia echini]SFN65146.1 Thioredoxin [Bizionia echini]